MRGLLVTLLVLVAVGVGADFGARAVAEDRVGVALQGALDLPAAPEVDVHGFPFLTQALAGRYDDVEVSAPGIRYGELEDLTLTARLAGVSLPVDALLAGRVDTVPADTVVAAARVDPADLARLFDAPGLTVAPVTTEELRTAAAEAADDPRGLSGSAAALRRIDPTSSVRLTSSVTVAGRTVPVSVIASFRLSGGRITLAARDIRATDPGASGALGRAASAALRGRLGGFSRTIDPGRLPFGIRAGGLRAEEGVLVVSGTARDVDLLAAGR